MLNDVIAHLGCPHFSTFNIQRTMALGGRRDTTHAKATASEGHRTRDRYTQSRG